MNGTAQLEDIVEQLQEWSKESSLIEEALEGCRACLENNEREDKEAGIVALWKLSDI